MWCLSDWRLLHDSAVGSSENLVLVDQGSSAEVETIGELFQRQKHWKHDIYSLKKADKRVFERQMSYLERDLPGPRTRDGILSVHNPAADRLWFNRRHSTTCYYRTQHIVHETRMKQEALKAGFVFSKYICPSSFLQTKGDTYPEQRPPGQGRWWRRWWRSWCRWVCDGSHWCICRSSLLLLYHLQQLINLRRDGGPSHQIQWTHSWGMFRSVIAEDNQHLHCPEKVTYEQRGGTFSILLPWEGVCGFRLFPWEASYFHFCHCILWNVFDGKHCCDV